ncbi:hypothetical protein LTR36_000209 [Oleoguttula mirabilis]|uniref:rRNA biogenesis protein RRP36 n=1 Tax=Oleoguttula mirabilis TaxID=1507867 RepID=A0AAV9JY50_9PEZI|nr:hypothetical protein LTR36_000209 [Oleoguttula mirabilis]
MAASRRLERNVRPKQVAEEYADDDDDAAGDEGLDGSRAEGEGEDESDEEEDEDDGASMSSAEDVEDGDGDTGPDEASDVEGDAEQQMANISFGTLKQANDALSRKRKRGADVTDEHEDKLEALRKRLRQIREEKAGDGPFQPTSKAKTTERDDADDSDDDDADSDSAPSEEGGAPSLSRTSKHAPTAQSSTHQVTRKRLVVDVPKRVVRDPRFDALQHGSAHPGNSEKAYSFLLDYQRAEIAELRAAIKRSRNEDEKALLRRKMNSMENRLKAKAAKDREQEVVRNHRKEEKERVQQGKTPFYLKQKDVKERALVEKFKGMKGKEREKLVEKRRKKEGQKEKKRMPRDRRLAA